MSNRFRQELKSSLVIPVGWLFADLLLALAMLFLVANTVGIKPPHVTPTPVVARPGPTPTVIVSPTPILRILESNYCEINLNIDANGVLNNSPNAIQDVENQLIGTKGPPYLQNRQVGIAVVYGGANSSVPQAQDIAREIYGVLRNLGKKGSIFGATSFYEPLFNLDNLANQVVIDIYLVAQKNHPGETCGKTTHKPL